MSIYNVDQQALIERTAEQLKKQIKKPEWAQFVKTGVHKERPPADPDWWYLRAAAILNKVVRQGPIGVSTLRTMYGGKKNRGVKKERFYKGSGNVARTILQDLEKAGLIVQGQKGIHKGRIATPQGKSLLDKTAVAIHKAAKK